MKRIKYVSQFAKNLTREEINSLIANSAQKNARLEITGFLMISGRVFLQLIEGPDAHIDDLFQTISNDDRHRDVLLLSYEMDAPHRFFPDWSMRKFDLDDDASERLTPVRQILVDINEKRREIARLTHDLERTIWQELADEDPP